MKIIKKNIYRRNRVASVTGHFVRRGLSHRLHTHSSGGRRRNHGGCRIRGNKSSDKIYRFKQCPRMNIFIGRRSKTWNKPISPLALLKNDLWRLQMVFAHFLQFRKKKLKISFYLLMYRIFSTNLLPVTHLRGRSYHCRYVIYYPPDKNFGTYTVVRFQQWKYVRIHKQVYFSSHYFSSINFFYYRFIIQLNKQMLIPKIYFDRCKLNSLYIFRLLKTNHSKFLNFRQASVGCIFIITLLSRFSLSLVLVIDM